MVTSISYLKIQIFSQSYKTFRAGELPWLPHPSPPTCESHLLATLITLLTFVYILPFFFFFSSAPLPIFHLANYSFPVPKMKNFVTLPRSLNLNMQLLLSSHSILCKFHSSHCSVRFLFILPLYTMNYLRTFLSLLSTCYVLKTNE